MSHLAFGEKKTLDDVWPIRNKRFFLRADFENLMEQGALHLPQFSTIARIICGGGKVVVACSFGQYPDAPDIKITAKQRVKALKKFPPKMSTFPLVETLKKMLPDGTQVDFAEDCATAQVLVDGMTSSSVLVLQNLRMYRNEMAEESDDRDVMAEVLERYSDVFVNDVLATVHLLSAGTVELPKRMRHGTCGMLMEQEMLYFSKMLVNPPRPTVLVLGSVHLEEKLRLLESLIRKVDRIVLGGAVAIPFLKARGLGVGKISPLLCEEGSEKILWSDKTTTLDRYVKKLITLADRFNVRLVLPLDFITHTELEPTRFPSITPFNRVPDDHMILDIGPKTIKLFTAEIRDSRTLFWSGRMGCANRDDYTVGTVAIANAISRSNCISVVGGKNTVRTVRAAGVEDHISHMTTGPVAMLRVFEGSSLPALNALTDSHPIIEGSLSVSLHQLLRHCYLFRTLSQSQMHVIGKHVVARSHAQGDVITHEGDRVSSMFIVARGALHAFPKAEQGKSISKRTITAGETTGESDFIAQRISEEVVTVAEDGTIMYQLTTAQLEEAFDDEPGLSRQLLRNATLPLRAHELSERKEECSEATAVADAMATQRKPYPTALPPSRIRSTLTALASSVLLHRLTLMYMPFTRVPGTCVVAQVGEGVVMRGVHAVLRELGYLKAVQHFASPLWASISVAVAVSPLRLAATGVPFHQMRHQLIDTMFPAAVLACAPQAAHTIFLYLKSYREMQLFRNGRQALTQRGEYMLAATARLLIALFSLPVVAHRVVGGRRVLLAFVIKQLVALAIELTVERAMSHHPLRVASPPPAPMK
jgi:phosphoglycerate kinase